MHPHANSRLVRSSLGYDPFHWKAEVPTLAADGKAIAAAAAAVSASPPSFSGSLPDPQVWLASPRMPGPGLSDLSITPAVATALSWTVRVRFHAALSTATTVRVLWKPFDNESDWIAADASPTDDGSYFATISSDGSGAMFAVEVRDGQGAWRYPDPRAAMPYFPLPP